ncbi:MAG: hypothetical protein ACR2H3_13900 [Acidimicrobiales bacterium]
MRHSAADVDEEERIITTSITETLRVLIIDDEADAVDLFSTGCCLRLPTPA